MTVDKIKDGSSIVDVLGTVTNNCDSDISYVRVETTCFSSSGSVLDRDPEYVENIAGGKHAYYDAVIDASPDQVKNCVSEVMEAEYE